MGVVEYAKNLAASIPQNNGFTMSPALLGAAGSVINGALGFFGQQSANKTNLKIVRETNAANRANQEYQNEWNLDMWNKQNEYNSPAAQRQRLEAAGLNPIFNGLDGVSEAGQLQSADYVATPGAPMLNSGEFLGNGIGNAMKTMAEIKLLEKQADNIGADTDNKRLEGQILEVKAGNAATVGDLEIKSLQGNLSLQESQVQSIKQDIETSAAQMDWFRNQVDVNNKRYELDKISTFIDKYLAFKNYDLAERDYISRTAIANFEAATHRMDAETNRYNAVTRRAEVKIYGYRTCAEVRLMKANTLESKARKRSIEAHTEQSWDIHSRNKQILDNQVEITGNQAFASELLPDTEYWRIECQKAGIDLMEAQRIASIVNASANMINAVNPFSSISPITRRNPIGF